MSLFARLDTLKAQLDRFRPIPAAVLANLHEDMVLRWTYHSNAIEGNTLTLQETKVALEGVTVGGKTLREHFEAINHRDAIGYVESLLRDGERLTAHSLRSIHALILRNLEYYTALDTAHFENDPAPFVSLIATMAERAFEPYWHVLGVIPE